MIQHKNSFCESDADLFLQFMIENCYFDVVDVGSKKSKQSVFIKIPKNKIFQELKKM